jgi:flagellar hook-associated protein 1
MTLTVALNSARSSLMTTGIQSSVVSRNIAGANQDGYFRKITLLSSVPGAGVYVQDIQRATSMGVFYNMLASTSASSQQNALLDGIQAIAGKTLDDPQLDQSPAAQIAALKSALQQYETDPSNVTLAQAAVTAAKDMATSLHDATNTVQTVRTQADADMNTSVAKINQLLTQFKGINDSIVKGTILHDDITDTLDARDQILKQLSQEIGITVVTRANNDTAIYTDSGVTLFDKGARAVAFAPTNNYSPGTTGNSVYIDGVPVTGASAVMPLQSGKLVGLASLRDDIAVTYQTQLDEVARGLIEAFSEQDQSAVPSLPDVPGLFTYPGAPAIPPSGVVSTGLAGTISVSASVDPDVGGNPALIRDGAISGNPAYTYNSTGAAGFSDRIQQLLDNLNASRAFDPASLGNANTSLTEYAGSSASWLEALRKSTDSNSTYQQTMLDRSTQALSNVNGVNMDDEMAIMLQIERTYSASSKLISTVDSMLKDLLAAVG